MSEPNRTHTCHAIACNTRTKPEMFMCYRHWKSLPRSMQRAIWATYRPGQCDDWNITDAYANAAQTAIRHLAEREGIEVTGTEDELRLYDYLRPSETGGE